MGVDIQNTVRDQFLKPSGNSVSIILPGENIAVASIWSSTSVKTTLVASSKVYKRKSITYWHAGSQAWISIKERKRSSHDSSSSVLKSSQVHRWKVAWDQASGIQHSIQVVVKYWPIHLPCKADCNKCRVHPNNVCAICSGLLHSNAQHSDLMKNAKTFSPFVHPETAKVLKAPNIKICIEICINVATFHCCDYFIENNPDPNM